MVQGLGFRVSVGGWPRLSVEGFEFISRIHLFLCDSLLLHYDINDSHK